MIRSELLDRPAFYIDGEWPIASGRPRHTQFEAATEEVLGVVAVGGESDIDRAVASARAALDSGPWGRTSPEERAEHLRRFADALERRGAETAELVSRENGTLKDLSLASNVIGSTALLRTLADLITSREFESVRQSRAGETIVRQGPVGVVGAISTWNYPQLAAISKVAPALAAGCTVVLKPPLETALDAYILADAAEEAGLPAGVLNIVVGDVEAGRALVAHPGVDKIAFTGSTATGQAIGEVAGRLFKRMTLELGGKSAAIVLPDADVDALLRTLDTAMFKNGGQTCSTHSRVLVHRSRREEVVDALVDSAKSFVIGDPLADGVTLGPMATERHRDRVQGYIRLGESEGARLVCGGAGRPEGITRGWFVEPTVFTDVSNESRLAQEEVFGPVIGVIAYDTEEEAIALANASPFGLAGMVFTRDEAHGLEIAGRIRAGAFGVNYFSLDAGAPFGGVKSSGIGRELGPEGLDAYLEYKSIYVRPKNAG
ncbi:aldehyde dehydrogenase [Saccharopolyspora spinosa]|uniref:Aldehyde dehydrogenase (NAD+)/betaine-aldehyde dehydrogenase n=1 Tax=Saccharopolyspora spinosa TaxID=60894 RepID=A0A2N3XXW9_SACSN|nr:aldehyde dehydrogenase [Saccharopolyspora spinosa]PKW15470.1 aldehyde dehydrogenase (NAD+)/betaine-aldehyde dehydrogenase [Saccharopolyspora spinosa]